MSIAFHSLHIFLFRVLSVGLSFVIMVITTRYLDVAGRGSFAMFSLAGSLAVTFLGGLGPAIIYQIANQRQDHRTVMSHAIITAAALAAVLVTAAAVLMPWLQGTNWWFIGIASVYASLLIVNAYFGGLFLGLNAIRTMNYVNLLPAVTTMALWAALIYLSVFSIRAALWTTVVAQLVAVIMTTFVIRQTLFPLSFRLDRGLLKSMLSFGARIGAVNIIGVLNYRIDMILVEFFLGLEIVGIYSVGVTLAESLWFITSSLSTAAYMRIGQLSREESALLTVRLLRISLFTIAACSVILAFAGYLLIPVIFGPAYADAIVPFEILVPGVALFGAASPLSAYFTNQLGKPQIALALASFSVVINLVVSLICIPRWGMLGGAVATTLSYLLSIAASLVFFFRATGLRTSELVIRRSDFERLREILKPRILT